MKRIMAVLSALICFASAAFAEDFVNLGTIKNTLVAADGYRLHAFLSDKGNVVIAPDATITLWHAFILDSSKTTGAGITCMGNATIILEGENYVCGRSAGFPAIYVPEGSTLTIKGTGKLTAIGNGWAAGIGGGEGRNCGNIVIDGGVITAQGGDSSDKGEITFITDDMILAPDSIYKQNSLVIRPPSVDGGGPGIGAARNGSCGDITFNRGNVTAYGYRAPALGVTSSGKASGDIIFNRGIGKVHAIINISDNTHECIETDSDHHVTKNIGNGSVDKTYNNLPDKGDAINTGEWETRTIASAFGELNSNKTYKNNKITNDNSFVPCLDLGYEADRNAFDWPEGAVKLEGKDRRESALSLPCLTGSLSGDYRVSIASGATIELKDVTIGPTLTSDMPGITCNGDATIVIYGDNYVAGHGEQYPGIYVPAGHTLTIKGPGKLTAVGGGDYGVGIGSCGPKKERGGSVVILSGNINAIGGKYASAMGASFLVGEADDKTIESHGDFAHIKNGTVHTKGGVYSDLLRQYDVYDPLYDVDEALMEGSADGDEEFFRWNGYLGDGQPVGAGLPLGPWIYAVAYDKTTITGFLPQPKSTTHGGQYSSGRESDGYIPIVSIAPDAKVFLEDAVFVLEEYDYFEPDGPKQPRIMNGMLRCDGNATIVLKGNNNRIVSITDESPGMSVPYGSTLTFKGDGSLYVEGGPYAAAIGTHLHRYDSGFDVGSVVFNGGSVTLIAGNRCGRVIGALEGGHCGDVVFKKGFITLYTETGYSSGLRSVVGDDDRSSLVDISFGMIMHSEGLVYKMRTGEDNYLPFDKYEFLWDGSLDDLGDEDEAESGMKMKAMSALPKTTSATLLGADDSWSGDLGEEVPSEAIAGDGTVITGRLSGRHKISIAPDATVTLRNAIIYGEFDPSSPYAGLTCLGNATIILEEENTIRAFHDYFPAIYVPVGSLLTIKGTGVVYAIGGTKGGAGIGGGHQLDCGEIRIEGGEVHAASGDDGTAAGIGGGYMANCGAISILGGTIQAKAAGAYPNDRDDCAAGIGTGYCGNGQSIYIGPGIARVIAKASGSYAQQVGTGRDGTLAAGSPVISEALGNTVSDNTSTFQWNGNLAKVLSEPDDSVMLTALDGTTITGSNGTSGAYKKVNVKIAPGAKVKLRSATIGESLTDAEFTQDAASWAGITCLGDAEITLVGNNSVSSFNCAYPCVYVPKGSTLRIKGSGKLTADNTRERACGAGIGGGYLKGNRDCGKIIIEGGKVHGYSNGLPASGTYDGFGYSAGIGSGPYGKCDGIEICGGASEVRGWNKAGSGETAPQYAAQTIGGGAYGSSAYVKVAGGLEDNLIDTWADRVISRSKSIDLSQVTGNVTLSGTAVVSGELPGNGQYMVTIKDQAKVTLRDVTIYGKGAGIFCEGTASICLAGTNYVEGAEGYPGIYVPEGYILHVYANTPEDQLEVVGGQYAAGIGSAKGANVRYKKAGSIVIDGGKVVAKGGDGGAGIGSGYSDGDYVTAVGDIYISECTVIATGGELAAGIGSGASHTSSESTIKASCGNIGIYGGTVTATAGDQGAGIGSGYRSLCGDIEIGPDITCVKAKRGHTSAYYIGAGVYGSCGTVSFDLSLRNIALGNTLTLEFNPDVNLDFIPSGQEVRVLDTAIVTGRLTQNKKIIIADGATVTLSDVTIEGENDNNCDWAGLTCEGDATIILEGTNDITGFYEDYPGIYVPEGHTLTIKGDGVLNARGSVGSQDQRWAPGIGGGFEIAGGNVVIEGGKITATGGKYAAGIGGGSDASFGTIEINGGSVAAFGGLEATGIGSGYGGSCEGVSIGRDAAFVSATADVGGTSEVSPIGASLYGSCENTSIVAGLVQVEDGNTLTVMQKSLKLKNVIADAVVQDGMTLSGTLEGNHKISVAPGAHITLKRAVIPGTDGRIGNGWAGLTCLGDATITLKGLTNQVRCYGYYSGDPGIYVPEGSTLTIEGTGSLVATTHEHNYGGAGIGGGSNASRCGNITINGGRVTACGYNSCAGIGANSKCGTVTIGAGVLEVQAISYTSSPEGVRPIGEGRYSNWPTEIKIAPTLVDVTKYDSDERSLTRAIQHFDDLDVDYTFKDGDIITGRTGAGIKLSIADGATVTLRDAEILGELDGSYTWAGLTCEGDATIILEGENIVQGYYEDYPGIYVPEGHTLTIKGDGFLDVGSNGYGAGIGGGYKISCGNIVIEGGTITAAGGRGCAGIGGGGGNGQVTRCGNITITEGVTFICAVYGEDGVCSIGRGLNGTCGTVTIGGIEGEISESPYSYIPWNGDLDALNELGMPDASVRVKNGTILTGTLDEYYEIVLEVGSTNYLHNAIINDGKLVCNGYATIIISGDNKITSTDGAAIYVPNGAAADIYGNGALLATGTEKLSWVYVEDSRLEYNFSNGKTTLSVWPDASAVEETKLSEYNDWKTEVNKTGASITGSWDDKNGSGANAVANVFAYMFDEPELTTEEMLDFELGADGKVVIYTPEVKNGASAFRLSVIAADDVGFTENVVEYPLDTDGETAIDETDMVNRFFKVVAEPKW